MIRYILALCLVFQCLTARDIRGLDTKNNTMTLSKDKAIVELPDVIAVDVGYKTFYIETSFTGNWVRAGQFCKFFGMQLASVKSQEEQDKLAHELQKLSGLWSYWTSGNDLAKNRSFVWANGEPFQYTSWAENEPYGDLHCVLMSSYNSILFNWRTFPCSYPFHFICESYNKN